MKKEKRKASMKNQKIYDLKKRSFKYSLDIILLLRSLPGNYIYQILSKQLLRCATSIGANIIEAQAAPSKKDFANFYNIALKSANETKYWLLLIRESKVQEIDINKVNLLFQEVEELANILAKSLLTIRGK